MKTFRVKNLMIQFDSFDTDKSNDTIVDEMMRSINELLENHFSEQDPCIYLTGIDNGDIDVREAEPEDYLQY